MPERIHFMPVNPLTSSMASRLRQPRWLAAWHGLLALAVGLLLAWALPLDRWLDHRHDLQATLLAPPLPDDAALVVDADEASVQHLGSWPLRRDAYLPSMQWLLAHGAKALAMGLLLVDAREGDEAFGQFLASAPAPVLLGARSLPGDGETRPARSTPPGCPALAWPSWQLPPWARGEGAAARLAIQRVGSLSVPLDDDGVLRRLPLWQQAGALSLPLLPLATWLALQPQLDGALHCAADWAGRITVLGPDGLQWALDAEQRLRPWLAHGEPVAALPLWRIAEAAAGHLPALESEALARAVRGRVVFIGSSAALGDVLVTPRGPQSATALLAGTYDALAHGQVLAPPRLEINAALLLLALLPVAGLALRRQPPPLAHKLAAAALALLLLLAADSVAVLWAGQLSHIGVPLAMLATLAGLALWQAQQEARQEALQQSRARAEAEAASRVKSDFLAHVSHEIRTPLHALLGAAELLSKTPLDASQKRYVGLFDAAGQDLLQMLNDLLDLSKAEAGLLRPERAPFSLPRLLATQVLLFEARAAQKNLTLKVDADPELPEVVLGDAARLAQVLRNLLSNAIKFTSVGGITLAAKRGAVDKQLRFEVRDSGIGVPPDRAARLFAPYVQADSTVSRRFGGTGLGLAISRQLTEAMGGRIGMQSREGLGTTFHIELPLPATAAPPALARAARNVTGEMPGGAAAISRWVAAQDGRPMRLLLVDDSPHALVLARAFLEGTDSSIGPVAGWQVESAQDGAVALRRFESQAFDIVLMDLQMPVQDGRSTARLMREFERRRRRPPALLVALSGQVSPGEVASAREAGFDAHLGKPYSQAQLLAVLGLAWTPGTAAAATPRRTGPAALDEATVPAALDGLATPDTPSLDMISQLPDSDLPEAIDRLGSPLLYQQVLAAAQEPLRQFEARLAVALDRVPCHLDNAQRLAHDLTSIAATLGLPGLATEARRLELALTATVSPAEDVALQRCRRVVTERLRAVYPVLLAGDTGRAEPPPRPTPPSARPRQPGL